MTDYSYKSDDGTVLWDYVQQAEDEEKAVKAEAAEPAIQTWRGARSNSPSREAYNYQAAYEAGELRDTGHLNPEYYNEGFSNPSEGRYNVETQEYEVDPMMHALANTGSYYTPGAILGKAVTDVYGEDAAEFVGTTALQVGQKFGQSLLDIPNYVSHVMAGNAGRPTIIPGQTAPSMNIVMSMMDAAEAEGMDLDAIQEDPELAERMLGPLSPEIALQAEADSKDRWENRWMKLPEVEPFDMAGDVTSDFLSMFTGLGINVAALPKIAINADRFNRFVKWALSTGAQSARVGAASGVTEFQYTMQNVDEGNLSNVLSEMGFESDFVDALKVEEMDSMEKQALKAWIEGGFIGFFINASTKVAFKGVPHLWTKFPEMMEKFEPHFAGTPKSQRGYIGVESIEGRTPEGRVTATDTPAEQEFWKETFNSMADRKELLDEVPSARISRHGNLSVHHGDLENLRRYIDDTVMLRGPGENRLPPSFHAGRYVRDDAADLAGKLGARTMDDLWAVPDQEFDSADTSINVGKMAAPFKKIDWEPGTVNADIGGGRFDNATDFLEREHNVRNVIYDPFNRTADDNARAAAELANGGADTATVNNVLNVIQEPENRNQVIRQAYDAIDREGKAYFNIYEGSGDGVGKETSKGWQNNRKTADYLDEVREVFPRAKVQNGMIVAEKDPFPEGRVSQRLPTAVKMNKRGVVNPLVKDPLMEDMEVGLDSFKGDLEAQEQHVNLLRDYDEFAELPDDVDEATETILGQMVENLKHLYDSVPERIRKQSKRWYDGANKMVNEQAAMYKITDRQAAGVYAVLSPQRDWFKNVSLGNRVMEIYHKHASKPFSPEMAAKAKELLNVKYGGQNKGGINDKYAAQAVLDILENPRSMDELDHPLEKAVWLRIYDQTYNSRSYDIVDPEGVSLGPATRKDGKEAQVTWGSAAQIANAISIIEDGAQENITKRLGNMHKVRNFYNNIIAPNAGSDVTIDTHAVAAALYSPYAGNDVPVTHNFGGTGTKNNSITGAQGTYGLYAEAYRRAAADAGILPREMQSITWEAVRGLFKDSWKTAGNKRAVAEVWSRHKNGTISLAEARREITELAGGIDDPTWLK